MKIDELKNLFKEFGEHVKFEHDLKKKNWFNIGGKSKVFYKANNLQELIKFLKILDKKKKNIYSRSRIKYSNNRQFI